MTREAQNHRCPHLGAPKVSLATIRALLLSPSARLTSEPPRALSDRFLSLLCGRTTFKSSDIDGYYATCNLPLSPGPQPQDSCARLAPQAPPVTAPVARFALRMDPTTRPRPPASPYALAPQASLVPGASPAPSQDSTSRRSVPNQKHKLTDQELYNDWRRAQEKELRDRLARKQDVRRRNRAQGQTVRPRPSPPPQAPAMSRRPSSTASLNRHMADTSMRDRPPRAGGRSRRGGRTGPMNPEGKAHAAWVRQTGATCRSCRRRKVKVRNLLEPPRRSPLGT